MSTYPFGIGGGAIGDYALARRSERVGGERPRVRSADGELTPITLERLRAESHRALRNYPIVQSIISALRTYYVGRGVGVQARSADKRWNREAERYYKRWCQACRIDGDAGRQSMAQLQALIVDEGLPSGDIGFLAVADDNGNVKLQPIEAPLICNPPYAAGAADMARLRGVATVQIGDGLGGTQRYTLAAGNTIVEGVEVDPTGRAVAYYVTRYSRLGVGTGTVSKLPQDFSRIEAGSLFLLANASRVQTRGTPALAAVVGLAQYLSRTLTASVLSAESQASNSVYITRDVNAPVAPLPSAGTLSAAEQLAEHTGGQVLTENGQERVVRDLEPAAEIELPPGLTPVLPAPSQPNPNLPGFVNLMLRIIGGQFALPIEVIMADLSQSNFHSSQAAIRLAVDRGNLWQKVTLMPFLQWTWNLCIGTAIARGELAEVEGWDEIQAMGTGQPLLDPSDIKGYAEARAANLMTLRQAIDNLWGGDWEAHLADAAEERAEEARLGITPALMPGATPGGAGGAAAP